MTEDRWQNCGFRIADLKRHRAEGIEHGDMRRERRDRARGQRSEVGEKKTAGSEQGSEDRGQTTEAEDRGQTTEGRGQKTEDRRQRAAGNGQ